MITTGEFILNLCFIYEISVTEHQLLNRPEKPCEEKEDYDFLECVKTSQARSVGCRPPWDIWSPHNIPFCQTMDQLDQYEKLEQFFFYFHLRKIVKKTGCRVPCSYKARSEIGSNIQGLIIGALFHKDFGDLG